MSARASFVLRQADEQDSAQLLEWRNEPEVVTASLVSREVTSEEHERWLAARLSSDDCALLIVELDGRSVGQVRLDRCGPERAEVSIALTASARGAGIGQEVLREVVRRAPELIGAATVIARVKEDNERSLRAFAGAGFDRERVEDGVALLSAQAAGVPS